MFSTKTAISIVSFLSLMAISLDASTSFGAEEMNIPANCQKAAIRQTYIQLRQDSGWTAEQTNQWAYLHEPAHLDNDPENVVTVSVESTDIRDWDGYAAYKVTITPTANGCEASTAVLARADGF